MHMPHFRCAAASTHPEAVSSTLGYGTGVDLFTGKAL
jgi:hypothetical protein